MTHDTQWHRLEVALVSAGDGRACVPFGDRYRRHDDLPGFVSVAGGSPRRGVHREAHNQPASTPPPGPVGRQALIMCLRAADWLWVAIIVGLLVVAWAL